MEESFQQTVPGFGQQCEESLSSSSNHPVLSHPDDWLVHDLWRGSGNGNKKIAQNRNLIIKCSIIHSFISDRRRRQDKEPVIGQECRKVICAFLCPSPPLILRAPRGGSWSSSAIPGEFSFRWAKMYNLDQPAFSQCITGSDRLESAWLGRLAEYLLCPFRWFSVVVVRRHCSFILSGRWWRDEIFLRL